MNKKIIAGFGSLLVAATPIIAVTSCGEEKSSNKKEESLHKKYDEKTNKISIDYTKLKEYTRGKLLSEESFTYNQIKQSNLASVNTNAFSGDAFELGVEVNTLEKELIALVEKENKTGVSIEINSSITFHQEYMRSVNLVYKYELVENKDSSSNPFFVADINALDFDLLSNMPQSLNDNFYHESLNSKKEKFLNSLQSLVTSDIKVFEKIGSGWGAQKTEVDIYAKGEWTSKLNSLRQKVESFLTKVAGDKEFENISHLLWEASQNMIKDDLEENTTDLTPIKFRRKHPIEKFIK